LFSTCGFVATYINLHCTFPCTVAIKLVHAASLYSTSRTTALWGNKFSITNHNSNFNTSEGASETQYSSFNTQFILQKSWYFSRWGQ
jgi:hypothetical protein